jgi:hypothetical protein
MDGKQFVCEPKSVEIKWIGLCTVSKSPISSFLQFYASEQLTMSDFELPESFDNEPELAEPTEDGGLDDFLQMEEDEPLVSFLPSPHNASCIFSALLSGTTQHDKALALFLCAV